MTLFDAHPAVTVECGLNKAPPTDLVIVAGPRKSLRGATFDGPLAAKVGGRLTSGDWKEILERMSAEKGGRCPLHMDKATMVVLPETPGSRHMSTTHSYLLAKELRGMKIDKKHVTVVLFCPAAHALALVSAVAKCFPTYSRKTAGFTATELLIEIVSDNGESLHPSDLTLLAGVARGIRTAGRLADAPGNEMTTDAFVAEALTVAKQLGTVKSTVIRGEELLKNGFGGIYHVGKAGPTPPAFVCLSHVPDGAKEGDAIALVGKGIVFDTGGMQIKVGAIMLGMKRDMTGAAVLLAAFAALVKAGFRRPLHVCLCIAENNISPAANKADDVITMLSGKTVEIINTDAEGRLVLADGVYYAKHTLKAGTILDMATLTGGQKFMTGHTHGAIMCSQEKSEAKMVAAGRASGDLVQPMVYAPAMHMGDLASQVADMKNANYGHTEGPNSAIAALFIGAQIEFGVGLDWIHVDMLAPSAVDERSTSYGVALVTALLGEYTDSPLMQKMVAAHH